MAEKRMSYKVHGHVQGVFFRASTEEKARSIGLTGFVSNASDGSVQGEAQGSEQAIQEFVQYLHQGPPAASVSNVEQSAIPTRSGESSFRTQ